VGGNDPGSLAWLDTVACFSSIARVRYTVCKHDTRGKCSQCLLTNTGPVLVCRTFYSKGRRKAVPWCLTKHYVMQTYWEVEEQLRVAYKHICIAVILQSKGLITTNRGHFQIKNYAMVYEVSCTY
jgi:hypothetical protein